MTKKLSQIKREQKKDFIIEMVKIQKPETIRHLIMLLQERHAMPPEQTMCLLIEMEKEHLLHFAKKELSTPGSTKKYLLSVKAVWFWITIAIGIATAISVFTISDNTYPLVYLRSALGIIFVLFLPGFAFIKALFPAKVQTKTYTENMDIIERIALSFVISLAFVSIIGLILNYTQWGIQLTPITLSLLALTIFFATVAVLREYQTKL